MLNSETDNKIWYVLYVNVRHEKKVLSKFEELGIEAYVPIIKTKKKWSDRIKTVEEPLFTGYVFVKLWPHELDKPNYVSGVVNYLSFGNKKATVRQSEIDSLKFLIEKGYTLSKEASNFKIGTKVKLLLSGFKEEIATVHSIDERNAIIYFEGLNQFIKVKVPVEALEKDKT